MTDISCEVVYEATLASLVLFRSYCYVASRASRSDRSDEKQRHEIKTKITHEDIYLKDHFIDLYRFRDYLLKRFFLNTL